MSKIQDNISNSTAPTSISMISKPITKLTRLQVKNTLNDAKQDKHVKLETLIQYIFEVMKDNVSQDSMKEAKIFYSQLMLEYEGDKEYFLPWVRLLDIAHVHKTNKFGD